jgi:hypothetical protein
MKVRVSSFYSRALSFLRSSLSDCSYSLVLSLYAFVIILLTNDHPISSQSIRLFCQYDYEYVNGDGRGSVLSFSVVLFFARLPTLTTWILNNSFSLSCFKFQRSCCRF